MKKERIVEDATFKFYVETLKTNIQKYNSRCSIILNWKEVSEVAKIFCDHRKFSPDNMKMVYDIDIKNIGKLEHDLKVLLCKKKYELAKTEFVFLYMLEVCVTLFQQPNGEPYPIITHFVKRTIRVLKGRADLIDEKSYLFRKEDPIINYFPKVYQSLNFSKSKVKSKISTSASSITNQKNRRTSWKEFSFLFFCQLHILTKRKEERNTYFRKYLPKFHKNMPLTFSSKSTELEIAISSFIDKFNDLHGDSTFRDPARNLKKNVASAFNQTTKGDMFGFYCNGFSYEKFDDTVKFISEKYKDLVDENMSKVFREFKSNPSIFIN